MNKMRAKRYIDIDIDIDIDILTMGEDRVDRFRYQVVQVRIRNVAKRTYRSK